MIAIPPPNQFSHGEDKISYPSGLKATLPTSLPSFNQVSVTAHTSRSRSLMNCFITAALLLQDLGFIRHIERGFGLGILLSNFLKTFMLRGRKILEHP